MPRELNACKASSPRCTPPGDFTRDHGLAAGLLARRSVLAAAFPRAKAPSGIVAENSLLTVAGAAVALCVKARTTFPFDPLREPPRLQDEFTAKLCQAGIKFRPLERLVCVGIVTGVRACDPSGGCRPDMIMPSDRIIDLAAPSHVGDRAKINSKSRQHPIKWRRHSRQSAAVPRLLSSRRAR